MNRGKEGFYWLGNNYQHTQGTMHTIFSKMYKAPKFKERKIIFTNMKGLNNKTISQDNNHHNVGCCFGVGGRKGCSCVKGSVQKLNFSIYPPVKH
jgi:hypothetical protein